MKLRNLLPVAVMLICFNVSAQKHSKEQQGISNISLENLVKTQDNSFVITEENTSSLSSVRHVYLRQAINGIEVLGTESSIHFAANGTTLKSNNSFVNSLSATVTSSSASLSAEQAIAAISQKKGYALDNLTTIETATGVNRKSLFSKGGISKRAIPAKLVYFRSTTETRLAWDISIDEVSSPNWYNYIIDAATGTVLKTYNWTVSCNILGDHEDHEHSQKDTAFVGPANQPTLSPVHEAALVGSYFVYPMPVESPNYGAASTVVDPDDAIASPFGWHDTDGVAGAEFTITRGNNAHAYEDGDNPGFSPDGGAALNFNFPINPTYSNGDQSESGIITNLFYWNNIIHDVTYQYGFDSASGNFQDNTYGMGGLGNDAVNAEAQDGSGTCNANMATGPDGGSPRMQMYICNDRDGDIDNGVVVHEYVHGVSSRLTGGASNAGCLSNQEQMGEGWSDYYGLMLTLEPGDMGTDARPIGTWLLGQGPGGNGIRTFPYSTNFAINSHTYDDINTESVPHGVGSVWSQMLWEMTWELIAIEGFDADIYNGTGGNNTALALVTEGLKLQPCSPGFVDGRDAILAADQALYGGSHVCEIWAAFARRGLGFSADQGSSNSRSDGTEAFDLPPTFSSLDVIDEVCLADGIQTGLGGGLPEGGVYSGSGVTDDGNGTTFTFDPSVSGEGPVTISYAILDFCTGAPGVLMDDISITDAPPVLICKGAGLLQLDGSAEDAPGLNIEDLTTVSTTIEITQDVTITDLNIALDINHSYVEDMVITLISPAATPVIIFNGAADGCSGDNLITLLDDESANGLACNAATPAFPEPNYIPSNALAAFDGESTMGTWTITIQDTFNQDQGILNYWRLDYGYEVVSLPLDVFLDISGNAVINADQLLESVSVACGGFTVTAGAPMGPTVAFTNADIGTNNVDVLVTSDTGKTAMCVAIANVIENTDGGQSITCPEDVIIACGEDTTPTNTGIATAISSCDPDPVITFTDAVEQTCGNTQIITRTWFSEDNCGSDIVSCIQTITTQDIIAPSVQCPEDIAVNTDPDQCTAVVDFDIIASDTCGAVTVNQINGLASGSEFPIGDTVNEFEIVDDCGNTTACSFTVTVENGTIPEAICQNITVQLDASGMVTITAEDVNAGPGTICVSSNASIDIDTFDCSNIGENNVVLTVEDNDGNMASCIAVVTVEDTLPPEAICAPITVALDAAGMATITGAMLDGGSTDNCDIVSYEASMTSFDCTMIGENTVTLTVTDAQGNVSDCETTVTIIDNLNPTALCQNVTIVLDADGMATIEAADIDNGSFDTCGNVTIAIDVSTFTCDNIGSNNVVLLVTDENGNESECEATVTVQDNTLPTAVCQNIVVEINEDGDTIFITPEMIDNGSTDNCDIASYDLDITMFDCSDLGDNEVQLTVTDTAGNVATCTAIVTVNPPSAAPIAACQNITVVLDENGMATLAPQNLSSNDAFNICGYVLTIDMDTFTCEDAGSVVPVTLTVTNAQGLSDSCVSNVFIVDNIDPTLECPEETIIIAALAPYELPDYVADGTVTITDNCFDQLIITQDPPVGTLVEEGETEISITVTDPSGNTVSCQFDIFIDPTLNINASEILRGLQVFPNPTAASFSLSHAIDIQIERISILDISGRIIKNYGISEIQQNLFSVSDLASATYFVSVMTENGNKVIQLIKR
jgi:subtilisin-like proprotein convertase family protein/uncharacterized protein YrzB (UPF0473 family)